MTSPKFGLLLTPSPLCHNKTAVLPTPLYPVSQQFQPQSPFLHDVIYEWSLTCEMSSPTVTASWLTVPRPPRSVRGEISEMYIGTREVFRPGTNRTEIFLRCIDRDWYFSYLAKTIMSYTTNVATFVVLRHPVTIWVTDFTNPYNLTNDLLILNKSLALRWCN